MDRQRKRGQKRYLRQQGLKRASIKHESGKLIYDCDNAQWVIAMPEEPGSIVSDLAKDNMPEEVARVVQQFEDVGLPPTGVVYDPSGFSDDEDDSSSNS